MTTELKLNQLADRWAEIKDQRTEIANTDKTLAAEQNDIERMFLRHAEDQGLEKFSSGPISVTVKDEVTFRHDPAYWNEVMEICLKHQRFDCVQKRPNSKVLQEMFEEGVLPADLLKIDTFKKVSVRKS